MTLLSHSLSKPAFVPSKEASTVPTPIAQASGGSVPRSHVDPSHEGYYDKFLSTERCRDL